MRVIIVSVVWEAIRNIEGKSHNDQYRERYIMLGSENIKINWFWEPSQVREFDRLFKEGYTIKQLSKYFKRPQFEIALMLIDRDLLGKLGKYDEDDE